jgi:glutamate dehydrogenase
MSGDVFGNGMLLSKHVRLVAAFNHMHIFLDPDPDPKAGYAERKRLFSLKRSTWNDYRREAISMGGGIYSRRVKEVKLHPAARKLLGIENATLTPPARNRTAMLATHPTTRCASTPTSSNAVSSPRAGTWASLSARGSSSR